MPPPAPDPDQLIPMIEDALYQKAANGPFSPDEPLDKRRMSSVLLLLGQIRYARGDAPDACFILNKRSEKVRQSGDLCCPGGGAEPGWDRRIARLLHLPFSPLRRWAYWKEWRKRKENDVEWLPFLLATSLRESFEEMRLNPFRVRFLGPLAPQRLLLFQKTVYPMVGWIKGRGRLRPNREVSKIIYLPLSSFFDPSNYRRFRFKPTGGEFPPDNARTEYPCFTYPVDGAKEVLWGATYRMVISFMETVFDFQPPEMHTLDLCERELGPNYMNGPGCG